MNEFLRGARSHLRGDVFFVSSATCKADGDVQGKFEFLRGWLCVISYFLDETNQKLVKMALNL